MRCSRFLTALTLSLLCVDMARAADETETMSVFHMFFWTGDVLGVVIIYLLLIMSVFSVGYSIMVFVNHRRNNLLPEGFQSQIGEMIAEKRYREAIDLATADTSYLARLVSAALNEASNGVGAMERAAEETSDTETTRMLRPIEYLNVAGNISPMMGLFGTVYGMIRAFQVLVEAGGRPDPTTLAAGISTALVTTFWGLVVAIPALAVYALIRNKIDALAGEGLLITEELIKPFRTPGRRQAPAVGRPRATPKPEAPAKPGSDDENG